VVAPGDLQAFSYRVLIAEDKSASLVALATPPRYRDFIISSGSVIISAPPRRTLLSETSS
jgi:hypothetical protein